MQIYKKNADLKKKTREKLPLPININIVYVDVVNKRIFMSKQPDQVVDSFNKIETNVEEEINDKY